MHSKSIARSIALLSLLSFAVLVAACGPSGRPEQVDGDTGPCTDGENRCAGNTYQTCNARGEWVDTEQCPMACSDTLGCVVCLPGTGTCNGEIANECLPDGSGYHDVYCDPVQGMSCGASGTCEGACAPATLGETYIGCEYYATVTGNTAGTTFDFAVAIANTTSSMARVTVEGGALGTPMTFDVAPSSVAVQILPWVPELKLCNTPQTDGCIGGTMTNAALAVDGAYHIRTTQPVTMYQFNALQYQKGGQFSYSNDASLLLPTNAWDKSYYVAAYPQISNVNGSLLAVTAGADNTVVTLTTRADSLAAGGAPAFTSGTAQNVTLNAGDVLEISSKTGDFTGSYVTADKPVEVIGGHYCAGIPVGTCCCDHLEESMFSIDQLGGRYVINAPAVTTIPQGKVQMVRVIAVEPNTNLTFDPPQPGAPTSIANAGVFIELQNNSNTFAIESDRKILVAEYMTGQGAGGNTGDPAMALAVPVDQYRTSYMFHAPTNYESNYVDVTAPMGAAIMLDGAPVSGFTPIGSSGFGLARVYPLTAGPLADGNHTITGDMAFGIQVYGYGQYTSYWYPGGLDLGRIVVE